MVKNVYQQIENVSSKSLVDQPNMTLRWYKAPSSFFSVSVSGTLLIMVYIRYVYHWLNEYKY